MNDLRFAIRQLFKSSGFAAIAILTLALGIGLNTSMFSLMNELLLRPVPYPDKDHLVRVARTTPQEPQAAHCAADVLAIQREAADFVQLGAYRLWGFTLAEPGRSPVSFNGLRASAEFFSILGTRPLLGRTFTAEENLPGHAVVILSHTAWQSQFGGDPSVIDRVVQLDGQATTIIGVMPPEFTSLFLWGPTDVFCPLAITETERANRAEAGFMLVGRFKPDLSLEQLNTRLGTVARRLAETRPREQGEDGLQARTLQSVTHSPESITGVALMVGLAGGVLLIVCGNLANLQLARASMRMREFAIRAALGASRGHLLRPLLAESVLLAVIGGALGIVVALWSNAWIVHTFTHELPFQLHFDLRLDWRVLMFAITASLVTGVLFGLMPAWLASRVRVNDTLKSSGRGTTGDRSQHRFRNSLIVTQFAAALVLLACAGFFMRGLSYLSARDPGWDTSQIAQGILNLPVARYANPEQTYAFYTQAQERLRALPGVENVSVAWTNPMFALIATRNYVVEGREPPAPGREPLAFVNGINPTFLDTLGLKLTSGRNFSEGDRLGVPPVAMINQSMANALFPGQNPVGQRLVPVNAATRDPVEIVGVFADVALAGNPSPQATPFQLFLPLGQECWNYVTISVRSSNPAALIEPMRQTLEALDPTIPVQALSTADKLAASGLVVMQVMTKILAAFGALGLFLAAIGLYGVIARIVVQRTTEIGVRLALGAQLRDVLWLVLGSGLRLTLIGAAIGLVLSFVLALLLRAMFPNDSGIDFATMLIVTALLLAVALLASYLPARRATKVDPLTALRAE
jgi:putative ABC transport system permease protein